MVFFRAITAEEEAATVIFYSLKRLGYDNAEKLNTHNHEHKISLYSFLIAVNNYLASIGTFPFPVSFVVKEHDNKKTVSIRIQLPNSIYGEPDPPLNFSISDINEQAGKDLRMNTHYFPKN